MVPELVTKLKKELNIEHVIIGYGMTETSFCHSVVSVEDETKGAKLAYESCGRYNNYLNKLHEIFATV